MLHSVAHRLVAVACFGLAGLQAAAAADLTPVPPYVAPTLGWTGFYFGGQLGAATDTVRWGNVGASSQLSPLGSVTTDRNNSAIGGGQLGYNFQAGNVVLGIEGSLSAADLSGSFASPYGAGTWSSRATWLATVTGRAGYSLGQWMPYVKGGLATANLDTTLQNNGAFATSSSQHYGWTAGAGIEYKLTPKWSMGLEYLYSDFGRNTDISAPAASIATGLPATGVPESYTTGLRTQSVMGRLNYKIGW
jgi:outer membrane immunogenic protein